MNDQAARTLEASADPQAVKQAALELARSAEAGDISALYNALASGGFYGKLDAAEDYRGTYSGLRLAVVVETLSENRAAGAEEALLRLTRSDAFNGDVLRMQILIRALVALKPSPPQAIAYWDRLSQPGSPIAYDVVEALCLNQSAPAMTLLEAKFNSAEQKSAKVVWMRKIILPRRNDQPLLACSERLLKAGAPKGAETEFVEAIFSYDVQWYRGCDPPKAPPLALAAAPSKEVYRRLADLALAMKLPPALEAKVKAVQELLGKPAAGG